MQCMRDVLRSSLARSLRDLTPSDRLQAAWPVACGSALAAHGEMGELSEDGALHITVRQPEWLETFRNMRSALANDLARIAGVPVRAIHFESKAAMPQALPTNSVQSAPTRARVGPVSKEARSKR